MDNLSTTVNFNKSFAKVRLIWVTKLNLNKANSTGTCTIFLLHARHHLEKLTEVATTLCIYLQVLGRTYMLVLPMVI
jgi:hypothetical protein